MVQGPRRQACEDLRSVRYRHLRRDTLARVLRLAYRTRHPHEGCDGEEGVGGECNSTRHSISLK